MRARLRAPSDGRRSTAERPWRFGTIWPVLLLAVLGCNWRSSPPPEDDRSDPPEWEIFVLPADFRGPVFVLYGEASGKRALWRGDTAFYSVPANGILKTAGAEPWPGTHVALVFENSVSEVPPHYASCTRMRFEATQQDQVGVCWFDYTKGSVTAHGRSFPGHIVGIVTDWRGIPDRWNRTSIIYDSLYSSYLGRPRPSSSIKWEEPRQAPRVRPPTV